MSPSLPAALEQRFACPGSSYSCCDWAEPELSFGRHRGPAPNTARRAAVLLILCPRSDGWTLPLTVRTDTLARHGGQISFPGGMLEPGESSEAAALREVEEEIGVTANEISILGKLSPIYVWASDFVVTPHVGLAERPIVIAANPVEVAETFEAPLSDLRDPARRGNMVIERRGLKMIAPCIKLGRHHIWGATLAMLSEFLCLLDERTF